jgi:enterochelin esterase family protein
MDPLVTRPLPELLARAARTMAPAYLRRRLHRLAMPYVEDETVTFVHIGDADAVRIVHFMACFPEIPPMTRLSGTQFWHTTVELPTGSRIEYKLEIDRKKRTDRILDPLNRRMASDPFGSNSVAHGPGYADPAWVSPSVDAAESRLETVEIDSAALGGLRMVTVYVPGAADASSGNGETLPTVYFHDGSDLLEYASLSTVLDNLIGAGAIAPLVAVLLDPLDRNREYAGSPEHAQFVVDEVVPQIGERFLDGGIGPRVIGGASLGAVAALATTWHAPGTFDAAVLLSGSFVRALGGPWNRGDAFAPVVELLDRFAEDPGRPVPRAWVGCGGYESLAEDNRAFLPVLEAAIDEVEYSESRDGHHWVNWRNQLGTALQQILPAATAGT